MPHGPQVIDHFKSSRAPASIAAARLDTGEVRWRCDPARLPFETTADVEPAVIMSLYGKQA